MKQTKRAKKAPKATKPSATNQDPMRSAQVLNAIVAEEVMGHSFWLEKRGQYELAVIQMAGDPEPWMRVHYDLQEAVKKRYTKVSALTAAERGFYGVGIPHYVGDMSLAWTVVEKMGADFISITNVGGNHPWQVRWSKPDMTATLEEPKASPSLAICLAAIEWIREKTR